MRDMVLRASNNASLRHSPLIPSLNQTTGAATINISGFNLVLDTEEEMQAVIDELTQSIRDNNFTVHMALNFAI